MAGGKRTGLRLAVAQLLDATNSVDPISVLDGGDQF